MLQKQDSDDRPGPSSASVVKMVLTQFEISGMLAKSTPFSNENNEAQAASQCYCKLHLPSLEGSECSGYTCIEAIVEKAEPRFKLPHHTYFTDTVIPAK